MPAQTGWKTGRWALLLWAAALGLQAQEAMPRVDSGARLEPRGVVMHGAGQDPGSFDRYRAAMPEEAQPLVTMYYIGVKDLRANWAWELRERLLARPEEFLTVQIGLSMTKDGSPGEQYAEAVAAGEYDGHLDHLAAGLRSLTVPVYLRIGYEFNGLSWNGYLPESYKAAFRRIVDRLRAEQPELEVATVWCAAIDGTRNFEEFYPGDEYVDWYGIDIFAARHFGDGDVQRFVEDAAARRKPVMLGETTPRGEGAQRPEAWGAWFEPYFDWIRRTPQVKQVNYINWNWAERAAALNQPGWANWGDARLETELAAPVRERYVAALRTPELFQHAVGESAFRQSLGLEEEAPPEAPVELGSSEGAVGGVGLRWAAPAEGSGTRVARYYVYRDGALVGFATGEQWVDEGLRAGGTAEYRVALMSRAGTLSKASAPLVVEAGAVVRAADDFEDGTAGAWQLDSFHASAKAGLGLEEGSARVQVDAVSGTAWHLQFRRFVKWHEGMRYRVKLRAKADRTAAARLWLQEAGGKNTIHANRALALETEWREFEFELTAPATGRVAVAMILGGLETGTTVWVDEARVTELPR